jgi:hypothetical protein
MNRQLAVNQLEAFLFHLLHTLFQNRVILEFNRPVALNAN